MIFKVLILLIFRRMMTTTEEKLNKLLTEMKQNLGYLEKTKEVFDNSEKNLDDLNEEVDKVDKIYTKEHIKKLEEIINIHDEITCYLLNEKIRQDGINQCLWKIKNIIEVIEEENKNII